MTMQAQFQPPEPPNSRSPAPPSRSTDPRLSSWSEPHPGQDPASASAQDMSLATSAMSAADQVVLRQAAQRGEFRAIATLLNHKLQTHDIEAWVGEAGPGRLQITLTVKRPPKKEPLVRLIAHQLCSLQSDIITGANITTQVAATNLILWHQLVRLPASQQPTQTSQQPGWRKQIHTAIQAAGQQGQTLIGRVQIRQAWQQHWPHVWESVRTQYQKVRSLSLQPPKARSSQAKLQPTQSPSQSASQAPPVPPIQADSPGSSNQTRPSSRLPLPPSSPTPSSPPSPTDSLQWTELAMLPVAWSPAEPRVQPDSTPEDVTEATNTAPLTQPSSAIQSSPPQQLPTKPTASRQPGWLATIEQGHTQMMRYVAQPNYWVVGGVAIAVFAMGAGFEAVHQYVALQSRPSNHETDRGAITPNEDSFSDQPQASNPETSGITPSIPPSNLSESADREPLPVEATDPNNADPNNADPAYADSTNPGGAVLPSQPDRGSTVQTAVGEMEVVAIAPATPTANTVTLTFSNNIVVPLPPPEPPTRPKWQWPFSQSSPPPLYHSTDMAIALLNSPPQDAGDRALVSPALLQQGDIDLVSLASNNVATAGGTALTNTLAGLESISMPHIGIGADKTRARQPQIFDIKGHRIAVFAYADTHLYAASETRAGTNPLALGSLIEDMETVREQVDWVIVTYHWHGHLSPTPTDKQVELAHLAIDHGADVVVGHHPSVMQGGEVYQGRAIAYSLGPISPMSTHPATHPAREPAATLPTTALLKLEVSDRALQVGFLPAYYDGAIGSFIALDSEAAQPVFQAIESASQALTLPLASSTMTYLPHQRDHSSFSSSETDPDLFLPDRTDSFIGPNLD